MSDDTAWERVLIRSGFQFNTVGTVFDLSGETRENREYLARLLCRLGLAEDFSGREFQPRSSSISEANWLAVVEEEHGGAEGGRTDELPIMDTYMAGVVRWLNAAGIQTGGSCDGHDGDRGKRPYLEVGSQKPIVDALFQLLTSGEIRFLPGRRPNVRLADRKQLLDLAEILHAKRSEVAEFVQAASQLIAAKPYSLPRSGEDLIAYWQERGLIGNRPDIVDPSEHARRLRQSAEQRERS